MSYNIREVITMFAAVPKKMPRKYTPVPSKMRIAENTRKQQEYANSLKDAMHDKAFIHRTMDMQNDFEIVDGEGIGEW